MVKPYKDKPTGKKEQVTKMFDNIADNYDGLNRVITFGIDLKWRKKVVAEVAKVTPTKVIDVATGTGDLAVALTRTNAIEIVGLDLSAGMLKVGQKKVLEQKLEGKVKMILGDGEQIPFDQGYFDAATVAFGVRNFENLNQGLSEIYRVLRRDGKLVILETSVPVNFPFKQGYFLFTKGILPIIGKLFSKDKSAYSYLSESAVKFPHGMAFNNILKEIGFRKIENKPQTFGAATIYVATK